MEPIAKTAYPPLGLMKISTWLKKRYPKSKVYSAIGNGFPKELKRPDSIYITSLFTWDLDLVCKAANFYKDRFPKADIQIGGIAASLLPMEIKSATGITPHVGLLPGAEECTPDYSLTFSRKLDASITFTSRGCPRKCQFCCVSIHEPKFGIRKDWIKDINPDLSHIVFWDNNWLASPNFRNDCAQIRELGKTVDFNQGLDARLYTPAIAKELSTIKLRPIRFAFDNAKDEEAIVRAINLAKKYHPGDIRIYVLYNFNDTPEDLYHRLNVLNRNKVLAFPMEYRKPISSKVKFPNPNWNTLLLRAFKLSLMFYYRQGMITTSRKSFHSIYGKDSKEFVKKLYEIYEYDKKIKRKKETLTPAS